MELALADPVFPPELLLAAAGLLVASETFLRTISEAMEIATLRWTVAARCGAAFMRSTNENLGLGSGL